MIKAIFLIQTDDRKGLLASVVDFFYSRGYNILKCQQHTDSFEKRFFMRIELDASDMKTSRKELEDEFSVLASSLSLEWSCHWSDYKTRMAILVSKTSHCLYDLLSRQHEGELNAEIPLIISNHPDLERVAEQFRIPYYCLPVGDDKKAQEEKVRSEKIPYRPCCSCEIHADSLLRLHRRMEEQDNKHPSRVPSGLPGGKSI